jgi:hypothetical protein
VLRGTDPQAGLTLWEALLPEQARRLPAELAKIDAYLDDESFLAPWRALFDRRLGRPSVPVDTLLRLLYLKHRYQLGYERLWPRGRRLDLLAAVLPHRPGPARPASDHPGQAGPSRRT